MSIFGFYLRPLHIISACRPYIIMCKNYVFPCLLFFFFLSFSSLQGQNFNYDELKKELEEVQNETDKLDVLLRISQVARAQDFDAGIGYAEEAIKLAQELSDPTSEAKAQLELGRILFYPR